MTKWIVIWNAYGEWKCTSMVWDLEKDAAAHAKKLSDKDEDHRDNPQYKGICVTPVRVLF